MAIFAIRLLPEELRSLAFGSLSTSYAAVGSGFINPIRIFHLQNLTDANIVYSFDGVTDHGVIAAGSFLLLDVTANKTIVDGEFISRGTVISVATIAGETAVSTGNVYLSVFYGASK